jgi:DNA recombination protein RmuC
MAGVEEAPRELTAFELVDELEAQAEARIRVEAADDDARDMHGIDKLAIEERARAAASDEAEATGAA